MRARHGTKAPPSGLCVREATRKWRPQIDSGQACPTAERLTSICRINVHQAQAALRRLEMTASSAETVRNAVRNAYGKVAETSRCGCGTSCCGPSSSALAAEAMGYSPEETAAVPEGSNLGLGCGNPQAIAGLKPGEVVLDLGSGAGFDCFLAARQVGNAGHVIGVDMTPAMLEKARTTPRGEYRN